MNHNLKIRAVKREDNLWHFDHEFNDTKHELLCNGTEKVIDVYYSHLNNKEPQPNDTIDFFLSCVPLDIYDTQLSFIETNESGTTYWDEVTSKIVWLCPWLQGYFGHKPLDIYVKVSV